ncbi:hypothetical protein BD324DRAFT_653329 [Kockovaella imperatae]|uniref:Uncharacterized protein n=1 Tax=Kockovaella imperatae TaxID=4999 RepID=A0A1Y1UBU5_9TREE|nr:hypothetical protein BD324DRAFT_653329 [Kockovaella imperatae]ORX34555.1 hypothetical protein BD324DRAFT_653329 [Kockovaella imperatae]
MSQISRIRTLARSLPPSPLRQAGTLQLTDAIESILSRHFPESSASATSSAGPSKSAPTGSRQAISESRARDAMDGMLRSLQRIQSNAASKRYPLSERTLTPAHDPNTYLRILNGVRQSAKGQGRAWWKRFFQVRGKD